MRWRVEEEGWKRWERTQRGSDVIPKVNSFTTGTFFSSGRTSARNEGFYM